MQINSEFLKSALHEMVFMDGVHVTVGLLIFVVGAFVQFKFFFINGAIERPWIYLRNAVFFCAIGLPFMFLFMQDPFDTGPTYSRYRTGEHDWSLAFVMASFTVLGIFEFLQCLISTAYQLSARRKLSRRVQENSKLALNRNTDKIRP